MTGPISSVSPKGQSIHIESAQNSFLATSFSIQTNASESIKQLQVEFSRPHPENRKIVELMMRLIKNRPQLLETPYELSRCIREANPNNNAITKIIVYQNSEKQDLQFYISREASTFKSR